MRKGREDGGKKEVSGCWQPACSCTLALHETRGHSSQTNANRTYGNTRCASVWDSNGPETMIRLHEQQRSSCILFIFSLYENFSCMPRQFGTRVAVCMQTKHLDCVAHRRESELSPRMRLFYSFWEARTCTDTRRHTSTHWKGGGGGNNKAWLETYQGLIGKSRGAVGTACSHPAVIWPYTEQ